MKFRVGDYVVTNFPQSARWHDQRGVIKEVLPSLYVVSMDDPMLKEGGFHESELQLAIHPKWIVPFVPAGFGLNGLDLSNPIYDEEPPMKVCECGCASVGISNHSDYCPLYIKEQR